MGFVAGTSRFIGSRSPLRERSTFVVATTFENTSSAITCEGGLETSPNRSCDTLAISQMAESPLKVQLDRRTAFNIESSCQMPLALPTNAAWLKGEEPGQGGTSRAMVTQLAQP